MNLKEFLQNNSLLMDGAMGTYYQQQEHKEEVAELANVSEPELVLKIHREYLEAGADVIRTNTFAVNSIVLSECSREQRSELLRAACRIAKQAVEEEKRRSGRECFVAADIGPIVGAFSGNPGSGFMSDKAENADLAENRLSREQAVLEEYYHICDVFLEEGMDIFWLETFPSLDFVPEVLTYIKEKAPESFCSVSFCINKNGFTTAGQKAERLLFAEKLKRADAIGFNCGIGSVHLKAVLAGCKLPKDCFVLAAPNAGYAETFSSRAVFLNSAGYFGENMAQIAELGVDILGGCCGTMPSFIREMRKHLLRRNEIRGISQSERRNNRISRAEYTEIQESKKAAPKIHQNRLKEKLLRGEKVIAVELDPPYNADGEKLLACAKTLSGYPVDVLTFADSPMGRSRADSTLTALHISNQTGMQVIPHIACRDRNVIAMRSLLLGAHMNGLRNLLIVTGDPVPGDDRKTVTGVFDYNSIRFMNYVTEMNAELFPEDGFFFGGALNYNFPNGEKVAERMEKKMAAGCSFFLTQPIFSDSDVERIKWLKERTGAKILAGILPPVSLKNASFIRNEMAGMNVPDEVMEQYRADMTREEGEAAGAEIAKALMKKLDPFVEGYYFMLPFNRVSLIERIFNGK